MSKKKAFSGSTMTLKDFHGGSIPSDLPLPSAPGVFLRPSDRPGFDRQGPAVWGNPPGRSDHGSRPGSSGTTRNLDEKTSFLLHPAHIGRNFDEDERKPFDGVPPPRRTVSDNGSHVQPSRIEPKLDFSLSLKTTHQPSSDSHPFLSNNLVNAISTRLPSSSVVVWNSSSFSNNQSLPGSTPNVWAARKEAMSVNDSGPTLHCSEPDAVSRIARVSALEVVSSGRWQSKHIANPQPDVEVIGFPDSEDNNQLKYSNSQHNMPWMNGKSDDNVVRRYGETNEEDVNLRKRNAFVSYERASPLHSETGERNVEIYPERMRSDSQEVKAGELLASVEASERPKLNLLPRTKPMESSETFFMDAKQGYRSPSEFIPVKSSKDSYGSTSSQKPGSAGIDEGSQILERPKLNLRPRSQPIEQLDVNIERERKSLFGGARPRELVLKERGVDDVAINNLNLESQSHRFPSDTKVESGNKPQPVERRESSHYDQRGGRNYDRRIGTEKPDTLRNSWRIDTKKNIKDNEKCSDRTEGPMSWRKPAEDPNSIPPESTVPPNRKILSALELAQTFSRSMSDPKSVDRVAIPESTPGQNIAPFSRLTNTRNIYSSGSAPKQINGY